MSRETPEENNDEEEYWDDYEPDQEHAEVYFYPGMPTTSSSVREISKQCLLVLFCLPYHTLSGDKVSPKKGTNF